MKVVTLVLFMIMHTKDATRVLNIVLFVLVQLYVPVVNRVGKLMEVVFVYVHPV